MNSASDIAAAIIERHPGLDQMQLHKLLYLVQAAKVSWFEEPAFTERIEAWTYGPVVRRVAGQYKNFRRQVITEPVAGDSDRVDERTRWVIDQIVSEFGGVSGLDLAALTKAPGSPWRQVRSEVPDTARSDAEIPVPLIAEYHRKHGVLPAEPTPRELELAQRFLDGDSEALADLFEVATGVRPIIG